MLTPEEREAEENRRKLLAVEALVLALLLRRRRDATERGLRAGRSPGGIAAFLAIELTSGIATARHLARVAGASKLRAEAVALDLEIADGFAFREDTDTARDWFRARHYAASYARQWLRRAVGSNAPTIDAAVDAANIGTASALERAATTEAASAYNAGRTREARLISSPLAQRVWDATLDKRTCPTCSAADGEIVGLRENFPLGEPGAVHPRCRCSWSLVTITGSLRNAA